MNAGGSPSENSTLPDRSACTSWSGRSTGRSAASRRRTCPAIEPAAGPSTRLGVALAPRHLVADRPRDVLGDPPARHRDGGQRRVQRPAARDQLGPAGRDARPVGGGAGHPLPGGPAVRDPVAGARPHRPRHAEAGPGQRVVDVGVPPVGPVQVGWLEHDRSGQPGGSLPARQPDRGDPVEPERGQHPAGMVRRFRGDGFRGGGPRRGFGRRSDVSRRRVPQRVPRRRVQGRRVPAALGIEHEGDDNGAWQADQAGLPEPIRVIQGPFGQLILSFY